MLTNGQKSVMSDAMYAVANSDQDPGSWTRAITDPFGTYLGSATGANLDPGQVRVLYVEIFAKGDFADSADFKQFMTSAKLASNQDEWDARNLDARWAALTPAEQGPSELKLAADNSGLTSAVNAISSGLGSVGSLLVIVVLAAVAIFALARR